MGRHKPVVGRGAQAGGFSSACRRTRQGRRVARKLTEKFCTYSSFTLMVQSKTSRKNVLSCTKYGHALNTWSPPPPQYKHGIFRDFRAILYLHGQLGLKTSNPLLFPGVLRSWVPDASPRSVPGVVTAQ